MKIGKLDTEDRVVVIAEIGNNHEGSYALAEEMVGRAAEVGADVVKFQTFLPEHYVSSTDPQRLARLRKFQLSFDEFARLKTVADASGVAFLSTPFDLHSLRFLASISPALKIASGDNTFVPLLAAAAATGLPLILSTGLASGSIIEQAVATIEDTWQRQGRKGDLALLHCVVSYPVPAEQANVRAIQGLARWPYTIGYSDHTLGIDAAPLAVACGARIIEKHFTLDKNQSDFRDHQISADPGEFSSMVARIRTAEELLGSDVKVPCEAELPNETAVRRSIAAAKDLPAGVVLDFDSITWVRPGSGIPPGREANVLGKTLRRPLQLGQLISPDDLG